MVIKYTWHSFERMRERFNYRLDYVMWTFKQSLKLIRKNKLRVEKWLNWAYITRWAEFKFVFAKKDNEYTLITAWKRF